MHERLPEQGFPPRYPRAIALCVLRDANRICVTEAYDPVKRSRFYRPLGGTIEFGERGHETVVREIREELGADVSGVRYLGTVENIFIYAGNPGHEIVLLYEGRFTDREMERRDRMAGIEPHDTSIWRGIWVSLDDVRRADVPLYPDGVLDLLGEQARD